MATPEELEALARRCETEEGCWQLDVAISDALGLCHDGGTPWYTRSLDAAVSLVPDEFKNAWSAGDNSSEYRIFASLGYEYETTGLTPALALCAASLRARASLTEKG